MNIKEGAVVYEDCAIDISVNEEGGSVAFATDGVDIEYTLKSGSLPAGLTLNADGTLSGTATAVDSVTVVITASAPDCAPADANVTINVILPRLIFEGTTLPNGRVDQFYGEQLPSAEGAEDVTYSLKEGSALPAGLSVGQNGYVEGTPTERATRVKFTVVAAAEGYTSAEAEFTITILPAEEVDVEGVIDFEAKSLKVGYVGESYEAKGGVANAYADNYASVTYALAEGSTLPEGFVIMPNGDLRCDDGAKTAGTFKFNVTASAEQCESVTVEFTLEIAPAKLRYGGRTLTDGMVGTQYTDNIGTASAPDGAQPEITYTVKEGNQLPAGLTLSADGIISGTPTKAVKENMFSVTASAEGYTSVDAYFYIHIDQQIVTVTNGIFEAEYIDLDGFVGEGWSGSACPMKAQW